MYRVLLALRRRAKGLLRWGRGRVRRAAVACARSRFRAGRVPTAAPSATRGHPRRRSDADQQAPHPNHAATNPYIGESPALKAPEQRFTLTGDYVVTVPPCRDTQRPRVQHDVAEQLVAHLGRAAARLFLAALLGSRAVLIGKQAGSNAEVAEEGTRALLLDGRLFRLPTESPQGSRRASDVPDEIRATGNAVVIGVVGILAFAHGALRHCLEQAEPNHGGRNARRHEQLGRRCAIARALDAVFRLHQLIRLTVGE